MKNLFLIINLLIIAGCDPNLQIQVVSKSALEDCASNSSSESCQDEERAETFEISETYGFTTNDRKYELQWTPQADAKLYILTIALDSECEDTLFRLKNKDALKRSLSFLNDGKFFVCMDAETSTGELIPAKNNGLSLIIDRTPPMLGKEQTTPFEMNQASSLNLEFIDLTDLSFEWLQMSGPGKITFSDPTTANPIISTTSNGSYQLVVFVTDAADNTSVFILKVNWDGQSSTSDLLAPANIIIDEGAYHNQAIVNINYSNGSGVNFQTHNIKACTDGACSASCVGETTDTASPSSISGLLAGSTYYACVQSSDGADNTSAWIASTATVTIDQASPTATITATQTSPTNSSMLNMTVSFSKAVTGFTIGDIDVAGGTKGTLNGSGTTYTFDITSLSGTVTVNIAEGVAVDTAGNTNTAASEFSIVYDNSPPSVNVGADRLVNSTDTIAATVSDNVSANSNLIFAWSNPSGPGTITFGSQEAQTTTISASADGSYVIRLTVTDEAGNSAFDELSFVWDTTPPSNPSSVGFGSVFSASADFSLSWSNSSDPHFATHNIKICASNDCETGCISATSSSASPATVTGVDGGEYYGCVQGVDLLGHSTAFISSLMTMTVHTTPPTASSIEIAGGASYTRTLAVDLSLEASATASQMYICFHLIFKPEVSPLFWQAVTKPGGQNEQLRTQASTRTILSPHATSD